MDIESCICLYKILVGAIIDHAFGFLYYFGSQKIWRKDLFLFHLRASVQETFMLVILIGDSCTL